MSRESIVTWADGTTRKVIWSEHAGFSNRVPMNPAIQRTAAEAVSQRDAEFNTPEDRQKAIEAEKAERERKRMHFHFKRAIPRHVEQGWKHLNEELTDEEVRVYTFDNERRKFWGIKPVGIGTYDFWDQIDPEVRRYHDLFAATWANQLLKPPFNTWEGDTPVQWAGQGPNPDAVPSEPHVAEEPPTPLEAAKPRRRQKTPELNPNHKVRKSKAPSRKTNKMSTRKSLADAQEAVLSLLENQIPQEPRAAPATNSPSADETIFHLPPLRHQPTQKDQLPDQPPTSSRRPRRPNPHRRSSPRDFHPPSTQAITRSATKTSSSHQSQRHLNTQTPSRPSIRQRQIYRRRARKRTGHEIIHCRN